MKRAWRYRSTAHHKIPVQALFQTNASEVKLYHNRKANAENLAVTVPRPKKHGFYFTVRWASSSWILVAHGGGHGWFFLQASYKHLKLNPTLPERKNETRTMTLLPPAWA